MSEAKRAPILSTDPDGTPIITVPLTNGYAATLRLEDWEQISSLYGENWQANSDGKGRVYASAYRNPDADLTDPRIGPIAMARAIVEAKPGEIVRYRDGNTMNLRLTNLYIERKKRSVKSTATLELDRENPDATIRPEPSV